MKPAAIDTSRIESMVAQLKATAARAQGSTSVTTSVETSATKLNFADALKASLDQVNATQGRAIEMGQQFAFWSCLALRPESLRQAGSATRQPLSFFPSSVSRLGLN